MDSRQRRSRRRVAVIVVLAAWFLASLWWALQPINDSVPTGLVNNQQTTQIVHCDAPLSGNDGPTGAIPSLPAGRAYERAPCSRAHTDYRALFWVDTAVLVILLALVLRPRRRATQTIDPDASANGYATSAS